MIYINQFFFNTYNQLRKLYLNSYFYDKKISKTDNKELVYKPSPHLLSSLIKYQKKKLKFKVFFLNKIGKKKKKSYKNLKNQKNF